MSSGALAALLLCLANGCNGKPFNPSDGAPPATQPVETGDMSLVTVDKPNLFPLATAVDYQAPSTLSVTGTVNPDISRTIPVISIASGRVVAIHARIGDYVHKGQLLMEVQSTDISGAFDNYLKAVSDEHLTRVQLDRAKLLYSKGAIPQAQLEVAQDQEDDNIADLKAAEQQLEVLGVDKSNPGAAVKVFAPVSGYIIAQNVTNSAAAGVTYGGSATAFTIADLSHVWVICDVYENDLAKVHLGQTANIRLDAYPDRVFTGAIGDIGAVLDPTIRTAKVRIEVPNPGTVMRVGMFATSTFYSRSEHAFPAVPAAAVLHLHDRDWVYIPGSSQGQFRRVPVDAGDMLPGGMQEIKSGIDIGQQVVSNVLQLEATLEAQ